MRISASVFAMVLTLCACSHQRSATASVAGIPALASMSHVGALKVDFTTEIKPILEQKCQPCHFSGGKVYQKMPFDRPETIRTLGTRLFTRIKDENERRIIREFLEQNQ